jgi:outer membrane protein assembly factor BamB
MLVILHRLRQIVFALLITVLCQLWLIYNLMPVIHASSTPHIHRHSQKKGSVDWSNFGFNSQNTRYNLSEQTLSTLNVGNLKTSWKIHAASGLETSPIASQGILYISAANAKGTFYAINTANGKLRWSTNFGGPIYATPAIFNNVIYIGVHPTKDTFGSLFALDATTGAILWKTASSGSIDYSSPVVVDGVAYVSFDDGNLYAINANNGRILWTSPTQSAYSTAAVLNGKVYVGAVDGTLYALNAQTGKTLWSVPGIPGSTSNNSAVVLNNVAYISLFDLFTFNGYFEAFSIKTHKLLWSVTLTSRATNAIAVAGNTVYAGLEDGTLYTMSATTGHKLWSYQTGASIQSAPAIANGVVYIGSTDHNLYAFNATTGQKLWSYKTKNAISTSSPIVVNGNVYIGSEDSYLYAFS